MLPLGSYGLDVSLNNNKNEVLDILTTNLKRDSIQLGILLDSARATYELQKYHDAAHLAEKALELSKKNHQPNDEIEGTLLLARINRDIYIQYREQSAFKNTLKYYLKAITTLESVNDSTGLLPEICYEYGELYFQLDLYDLAIKNYDKALGIVSQTNDYNFQKEILGKLASLNYQLKNYYQAIKYHDGLLTLYKNLNDEAGEIRTIKILSQLYWQIGNYDEALSTSKILYQHFLAQNDLKGQVDYLSRIGEISFQANNYDQADKALKEYLRLVEENEELLKQDEVASLRFINNLILEGDIYFWHTENGYWSDYTTSIRYYNEAQKLIDSKSYPDLASRVLSKIGSIYFNEQDYKTCITHFNLALYYARKKNNHEYISESHIKLARAYDAIEMWKEASDHYELHSAYKDSLIQEAAHQRQLVAQQLTNHENERMDVEQTLDLIENQEILELSIAEKELRNQALNNEIELIKQQVAIQDMLIRNKQMAEDSVARNFLLTQQQLENVKNANTIDQLKKDRTIQNMQLETQAAKQESERQRIKFLEQENTLARTQQAYYVLSIFLISLILIFIVIVYWQKRKANNKLRRQNSQIESQSKKLRQAYKNLELLSTMGRDITSSLIIEEIIETVYENLNTLMDATVLGIGVYLKNENVLHFPGVRERNKRLNDIYIDLSNDNTLGSYCFNRQEEIQISNFYEEYINYIIPEVVPVPGDGNSTSIIYIPLTIGKKKLGVLTVQSFDENAFDKNHKNIIQNIGIYAKIALENANVYRELELQSLDLKTANRNIGKQKELIENQNEELMSINEEKNNLMRILAHDLRNPLATAMSMTELVRYEKQNLSASNTRRVKSFGVV